MAKKANGGRGWLVVSYLAGVASTLLVLTVSGCGPQGDREAAEPPPLPTVTAPADAPPAPQPDPAPAAAPPAETPTDEQAQIAEDAAAAGMTSRTQQAQ